MINLLYKRYVLSAKQQTDKPGITHVNIVEPPPPLGPFGPLAVGLACPSASHCLGLLGQGPWKTLPKPLTTPHPPRNTLTSLQASCSGPRICTALPGGPQDTQ
ncbi:unnamed protein product [Pleuronectes platessa]|uniref:Uncharacterized protein n=1 Tax=Pleuronectes platessa TaxID=8262 RepID=A0A9N7UIS6_PLEPL|nr:unnamed protein product [Pleuronectes platessa]